MILSIILYTVVLFIAYRLFQLYKNYSCSSRSSISKRIHLHARSTRPSRVNKQRAHRFLRMDWDNGKETRCIKIASLVWHYLVRCSHRPYHCSWFTLRHLCQQNCQRHKAPCCIRQLVYANASQLAVWSNVRSRLHCKKKRTFRRVFKSKLIGMTKIIKAVTLKQIKLVQDSGEKIIDVAKFVAQL